MTEKDALDMGTDVIKALAGPVAGGDMPAVDVADMRVVFKKAGGALYGSGQATGEGRAIRAGRWEAGTSAYFLTPNTSAGLSDPPQDEGGLVPEFAPEERAERIERDVDNMLRRWRRWPVSAWRRPLVTNEMSAAVSDRKMDPFFGKNPMFSQ